MMKHFRYFWLLLFPVFFVACADDPDPDEPIAADRTVLAYMAGNNNLSQYLSSDIDAMCQGMQGIGGHLIIYFASTDGNPKLYEVGSDGSRQLIKTYEGQNSMDPATLREVVNEVFEMYPANSYGLVLSSHGEGWLPAPSTLKSRMQLEQRHPNALLTKWFGQDGSTYMNITDLASSLPTGRKLDFLLFDACFMSSIEALYDLRNNAKTIIASPTEVMANGFPYEEIVPLIFATTLDVTKIAQVFVDSYRGVQYPSASVAVVNTAELEALASTVKDLMAAHPEPQSLDLSTLQAFELKTAHTYFDLDNYMERLSGGKDLYYQAFQEQLNQVVEYVNYTSEIYSAFGPSPGMFPLNRCCGISVFIPQSVPGYTSQYVNTAWAQAIGYQ